MKTNEIFNEVRMAYMGQPLTGPEVRTLLADLPYGKTSLFLSALVANGCIEHPNKGKYIFSTNPVHHSLLEKAIDYARKKANQYNKKRQDKELPKEAPKKDKIQEAIDLLLSTGEYEIFRVEKITTIKKTQL